MSNDRWPFGALETIIFVALCLWGVSCLERDRYRDCMRQKHDRILCDIYAKSGGR
jgi:hypothetical protein